MREKKHHEERKSDIRRSKRGLFGTKNDI